MSRKLRPQYADRGTVVKVIDSLRTGCTFGFCTTVPSAAKGFAPGCIMIDRDAAGGAKIYVNEGTLTSCSFVAVASVSSGTFATLNATNANIAGRITMADNAAIHTNSTNGTRFPATNTQKAAFWGATPIVQPNGIGELIGILGFADNSANATNMNSNGNTGTRRYTYNDVIKALKTAGILEA